MTDCVVRLGLSIAVIVMITLSLYQFGGRTAVAVEPSQITSSR